MTSIPPRRSTAPKAKMHAYNAATPATKSVLARWPDRRAVQACTTRGDVAERGRAHPRGPRAPRDSQRSGCSSSVPETSPAASRSRYAREPSAAASRAASCAAAGSCRFSAARDRNCQATTDCGCARESASVRVAAVSLSSAASAISISTWARASSSNPAATALDSAAAASAGAFARAQRQGVRSPQPGRGWCLVADPLLRDLDRLGAVAVGREQPRGTSEDLVVGTPLPDDTQEGRGDAGGGQRQSPPRRARRADRGRRSSRPRVPPPARPARYAASSAGPPRRITELPVPRSTQLRYSLSRIAHTYPIANGANATGASAHRATWRVMVIGSPSCTTCTLNTRWPIVPRRRPTSSDQ